MPRLILILLILLVLVYFIYRFKRLSPEQKKHALKLIGITVLGSGLLYMVLTGRLNWLIAAVGAMLPLIPRGVRFIMGIAPTLLPFMRRYQQNKQSSMQSDYLRLKMNILTGELQGDVLQGKYAGNQLQQMTLEQCLELLAEFRQQDAESAALMAAYLNRAHAGWDKDGHEQHDYTYHDTNMTGQEARDILGVSAEAGREDIIKAHKRLMQKMHPDRGGSDYLAQQINRAKDTLLKQV